MPLSPTGPLVPAGERKLTWDVVGAWGHAASTQGVAEGLGVGGAPAGSPTTRSAAIPIR